MVHEYRIALLILLLTTGTLLNATPCEIHGGRSELILDVTESIGDAFDQSIFPEELPIEGVPGEDLELELSDEGKKRFSLKAKSLNLTQPLDRDQDNLSTLRFEISCTVIFSSRVRSIPVVVRIRDVNDNPPVFKGTPYHVAVREDAIVNTPIFNGIQAMDRDSGRNGLVEYKIIDIKPSQGVESPQFSIRFPHQGAVFLMKPLDYETTALYHLTVLATDNTEVPNNRLNSTSTLTIRVQDIDDQNPTFDTGATPPRCSTPEAFGQQCIKEYYSSIVEGSVAGVLDVYPGRIHARDPDSLGASITYSFVSGVPSNFDDYFAIDSRSAVVKQIKKVDRTFVKKFDIAIQAMENAPRRGSTTVRLMVNVEKVDTSPPKLVIPGYKGKVLEASAPGTPVLMDDGSEAPFVVSVYDPDLEQDEKSPLYVFELTTNAFVVDGKGILVVAEPNLDRDAPSLPQYTFQLFAREHREGGVASAPVTLTVRLLDINDNAPRLPILPTVTFPAGATFRNVIQLNATDIDEGTNAVVKYELLSGSRGKFSLDENTGVLSTSGNLEAGEKFFLSVKATDMGNLTGEGFVEVVVSRGPNTNGPVFSRASYSATIPENIPYGEEIVTVQARDPEDDSSYYAITKGNDEGYFEIDTLTGLITVVAPLDRETKSQYSLEVAAEDSEGKSNSAEVFITITDVNDVSPSFIGEPYSFRVDEGLKGASVGAVKAQDKDLGLYGEVEYALLDDSPTFKIDSKTGQIFTNISLDYENEQVHYISVVAHDKASDPRSSTSTVTILVNDISDENPTFRKNNYFVRIPENAEIGSTVTAVEAIDKDTVPIITYKIIEGDAELFKLAPKSGQILLAGNLDYEDRINHTLVIGTEENKDDTNGAKTTVTIVVDDVNDETPVFDSIYTVTLAKNAPLNTLVTKVLASDKDKTAPNNMVKYSIVEEGTLYSYFKMDETSGEIRLRKSLVQVTDMDLKLKVLATDGGHPTRSSSVEFRILLLQNLFNSLPNFSAGSSYTGNKIQLSGLASSPRFSKDHLVIQVNENIPSGSVVAKVPLMNTTSSSIACTVIKGNEDGTFKTKVTSEGNCKIISSKNLDFEQIPTYNLSLVLHPQEFIVKGDEDSSVLSKALVEIFVRDWNDNPPTFVLNGHDILDGHIHTTVLTYALQEAPVHTSVIELKAMDLDSGNRGQISFHLLPESNRGNYFRVDSNEGRIYSKRELRNVPLELQPFNLSLVAMDNPKKGQIKHSSFINIIIPIIEESHRSVLILNASESDVIDKLEDFKMIISRFSDKFVQLEELKHIRGNAKSESQLWFHLLERNTWKPVSPEKVIKEKEPLLEEISGSIEGNPATRLISPVYLRQRLSEGKSNKLFFEIIETDENELNEITRASTVLNFSALEYALIALAGVIIFFVLSAVVSVCVLWARFSNKWNSADRTVMLIPPTITRPSSVIDSVSKEYEVQVLHMSVPLDDESVQETNGGSNSSRQAYIDNVSYISKSRNNLDCPSSGGSSGMVTPDGFGGEPHDWSAECLHGNRKPRLSSTHLGEEANDVFNACATNDNVMFSRRAFAESLETTTEL